MLSHPLRRRLPVESWRADYQQGAGTTFLQLLSKFTAKSQVHGLNRLLQPNMSRRIRLLWSLALFCACTVLLQVSYFLAIRHNSRTFQTVIQRSYLSVNTMYFPVVVICNKNGLNWSRLSEIAQRYNVSQRHLPLFEQVLSYYDGLSFGQFNVFDPLMQHPQSLESLNHLNFTQIVSELAWRCNELVTDCKWLGQPVDCCQVFRPRRIQQGICLAFNELEKRITLETDVGSGLQVRLHLKANQHAPKNLRLKGFRVYVVEPGVWVGFPLEVVPYTRTNIAVSARFHYYNSATKSVPSQQRGCIFLDEHHRIGLKTLQGYPYMLENCQSECEQIYLLRYCNCTMDLFYPPSEYRACQLVDLPCLAKHNRYLQYFEEPGQRPYVYTSEPGMRCPCMFNCRSLELITEMGKSILRPWHSISDYNVSDTHGIILNIFYKRSGILVYETNFVYTWVDLLVSFGGIFQLCLGCSIISIVELIFFALINVPRFWWQRLVQRNK